MRKILTVILLVCGVQLHAQQQFSIEMQEMNFPSMPGVHSAAIGEWNGNWIVIGGRNNGLHGFHPPLAFPTSGINNTLYVIDPLSRQVYTYAADSLSDALREAVTSSNMLYSQRDSMLYMAGGYGWKQSLGNFQTFPTLTAVNLKGLSQAIISQQDIRPHFRMIEDSALAVCGAHLQVIDSVYYMVWGHRFDGTYSRSDTTGFFVQKYTNAVRRFTIHDDGTSLSVSHLSSWTDTANFRRRDYNLVPQVFPDRSYGFTGFTGVFQKDVLLPHLNSVDITPTGYTVNNSFHQLLNQYHTAFMPVYDSTSNAMHTFFFGGTAQYYIDTLSGATVEDTIVPFVNTVSRIVRDASGVMTESALSFRMPGLLGTNAEFIPSDSVSLIHNEIIRLDPITERTFAGYIIGGINSPEPNINASDPSLSTASTRVFKVYIHPSLTSVETEVVQPFTFHVQPNPATGEVNLLMNVLQQGKADAWLFTSYGKPIRQLTTLQLVKGQNTVKLSLGGIAPGVYLLRIQSGKYAFVQRLVVV